MNNNIRENIRKLSDDILKIPSLMNGARESVSEIALELTRAIDIDYIEFVFKEFSGQLELYIASKYFSDDIELLTISVYDRFPARTTYKNYKGDFDFVESNSFEELQEDVVNILGYPHIKKRVGKAIHLATAHLVQENYARNVSKKHSCNFGGA